MRAKKKLVTDYLVRGNVMLDDSAQEEKEEELLQAPSYNFSALHLIHDPQELAENLFRPLLPCNIIEGFSYSVQSFGQFMFYYHVFFNIVIFVVSFSH